MRPRRPEYRQPFSGSQFNPVAAGFAIYDEFAVWGIGKTIAEAAADFEEFFEGDVSVLTIRPCTEALIQSIWKGHAGQWYEVDGIIVAFYEVPEDWFVRIGPSEPHVSGHALGHSA